MNPILVTLIHGTFAENAPWVQTESDFQKHFVESLDQEVEFETFNWSGKNSVKDRLLASGNLARKLEQQLEEKPFSRKILIGHSHGGNVALYALGILGNKADNYELITLSTPFLNSKKRAFDKNNLLFSSFEDFIVLLGPVFGMLVIIGIIWQLFHRFDVHHIPKPFWMIYGLITIPITLSYHNLMSKDRRHQAAQLSKSLDEIQEKLALDPMKNTRILSIVNYGDEVKWFFGLLTPIWEIIIWLHLKMMYLIYRIIYVLLAAVAFGLFLYKFPQSFGSFSNRIFGADILVTSWCALILATFPIINLVVLLLLKRIKSSSITLGRESIEQQLFIKTTPAITPFNYPNLRLIQLDLRRKKQSFKHSIYLYEEIFPLISGWLAENQSI